MNAPIMINSSACAVCYIDMYFHHPHRRVPIKSLHEVSDTTSDGDEETAEASLGSSTCERNRRGTRRLCGSSSRAGGLSAALGSTGARTGSRAGSRADTCGGAA